jgi:hypothetical protein
VSLEITFRMTPDDHAHLASYSLIFGGAFERVRSAKRKTWLVSLVLVVCLGVVSWFASSSPLLPTASALFAVGMIPTLLRPVRRADLVRQTVQFTRASIDAGAPVDLDEQSVSVDETNIVNTCAIATISVDTTALKRVYLSPHYLCMDFGTLAMFVPRRELESQHMLDAWLDWFTRRLGGSLIHINKGDPAQRPEFSLAP